MITNIQLDQIIYYFKKQPEVGLVFLFGSKARNDDRKQSDIDLAVTFDNKTKNTFYLQGKFMEKLTSLLGKKVDVVNMGACDAAFNYRVLSEGKPLYQKNQEQKIDFQTDLIRRYFDLKPTYDIYYQELAERARRGILGAV